jgi:methyl-accepting chemotaxis protein
MWEQEISGQLHPRGHGKKRSSVTTISTAVEGQFNTTKEITGNINQVSVGIADVNEVGAQSLAASSTIAAEITQVSTSANQMNSAALEVKKRAEQLAGIRDTLKEIIRKFSI